MILEGTDIGKKYERNWIFRHQNFKITHEDPLAIVGKNGAGKSTMLQIMAGYLTPSQGNISINGDHQETYHHTSTFIGPYTEVIEEFTLNEFLSFHQKFKKPTCSIADMAETAFLPLSKRISEFSTGMKQRTKLLTAFFFENDMIFMDEPTSNLDEQGFEWWMTNTQRLKKSIIVIASNDKREINLCSKKLCL